MKLTRDSYFKRLTKVSKNASTEKVKKIQLSHKSSHEIKVEQIHILDKNTWIISSLTDPYQ